MILENMIWLMLLRLGMDVLPLILELRMQRVTRAGDAECWAGILSGG